MAVNSSDTKNTTVIPSVAAKTTFLVIFLVVGLFGNLFLIITVGGTKKHRASAIHIITLNLAVSNLIDCLLNFSFAVGYTVSPSSDLDWHLCRSNSFLMTLVTVEKPLTLVLSALDRFLYSVYPEKYVSVQNIPRAACMIVYTWIHSLAFSFPLVAGLISIKVYDHLSVCLPVEDINTGYLVTYSLLCFVLPTSAIIIMFIFIIKYNFSQRDHIHTIMTQHQYSKDKNTDQLQCLNEINVTKCIGCLSIAWILCEFPFISTFIVELTFSNITYNACVAVTLLWLKFSYVMVLPLLYFTFHKDVWQTLKDMIMCKKRNSVVDFTNKDYSLDNTKNILEDNLKTKVKLSEDKRATKEETPKEIAVRNNGFQVPVFFANAHGVHMHTMYDDDSLSEDDDVYENPKVIKCDVNGSQEYLNQCDTSDYDSSNELDPFSVSHPVTSKTLKDTDETLQRRSNSHPEVRLKTSLANTSVTTSSNVDSGLDISATKTTFTTSVKTPTEIVLRSNCDETQISDFIKPSNIPGEVSSDPINTSKQVVSENELSHPVNLTVLDSSSLLTTDLSKHKKKKKKGVKAFNGEKVELSHTSTEMVNIKPPLRLQPIQNPPTSHGEHISTISKKLSLDMLSAQNLQDSPMPVATPSACQLVPEELFDAKSPNEN